MSTQLKTLVLAAPVAILHGVFHHPSSIHVQELFEESLLHFVAVTIVKSDSIIYATNKQISDHSVKLLFELDSVKLKT